MIFKQKNFSSKIIPNKKSDADFLYALYEASVQSPVEDVLAYQAYAKIISGKTPRSLREDFCGTFSFSVEWVKLHPKNTALALDIDPKPLEYGFQHHYPTLKQTEQKRIKILKKSVMDVTLPKVDIILANNFSFYTFHSEALLLQYFKAVRKSLKPNGVFLLEMVGGPGFTEIGTEERTVKKKGIPPFTYFWDQESFNPITGRGKYAIHFKLKNKKKIKHAFTYDWRVWSIPEVRYLLKQAGFNKTHVLWDCESKQEQPYKKTDQGENFECWIAYIGAV